jgi:hypothetical protein
LQVIDSIPKVDFDIPVDIIFTEKDIIQCKWWNSTLINTFLCYNIRVVKFSMGGNIVWVDISVLQREE